MFHAGGKEYLKKEWGASTWIDLPTLKNLYSQSQVKIFLFHIGITIRLS